MDSIIHISTAENIVHFKGLVFRNLFVMPPNMDVLPEHLAPPGIRLALPSLGVLALMNIRGRSFYRVAVSCFCRSFFSWSLEDLCRRVFRSLLLAFAL